MWNDIALGNCFTFNHRNITSKHVLKLSGISHGMVVVVVVVVVMYDIASCGGLRFELRAMTKEYASWTQTAGYRVFIHHPDDDVFVESNSISAGPNQHTSIALKRVCDFKKFPFFELALYYLTFL